MPRKRQQKRKRYIHVWMASTLQHPNTEPVEVVVNLVGTQEHYELSRVRARLSMRLAGIHYD